MRTLQKQTRLPSCVSNVCQLFEVTGLVVTYVVWVLLIRFWMSSNSDLCHFLSFPGVPLYVLSFMYLKDAFVFLWFKGSVATASAP